MILITGATGTIGSEVVRLLAAGGERVRAMTRKPPEVPARAGVEYVRGDFDDPDSLAEAARGAETLFLLSAPGPWMPRHDEAMLTAARDVRRVVKVSAIGTGERAGAEVGDWHLPGERALRDSDLEWTILRPSSFASNALRWPFLGNGPIPNMTGDGKQGVIDPRDVAEVAVRALTSGEHAGEILTLTGPELLSLPDMVRTVGQVLGRPLETVDVPLDAYRERLLAAGVDPAFADVAVSGARTVAEGGNARLTDDVERALGRAPRTFATWVRDHRAAFETA
ncbi:Oxidoreductase [[Actinomadura] parvosata subsp. kistnae]|uniref:NAD(P)-dependent oxidoreductase n=1 Tax=[Actinomadura] parvosata subsp. kistnae TaxID=1909395 RepID=A0A1V0A8H1_9ACTN|nr:SDR family oxidoreductase [Nonomuraea sp. ATCC 55076]AQZ66491.1 NAD(P)-dependent oxidoreductase [Nonomuraea sp. ATCC 55076]SPL95444.1 Oxidoreductase [Actinomadura parvosata subsp. kistnae]